MKIFLSLLVVFCLSGCGYRWAPGEIRTVSVPYISGDEDGFFTSELIRQLSASHIAVASHASYRLQAAIVEDRIDSLGYRRDPQEVRGKIRKDLVQNEARKTITVDVSIYENQGEKPIFGPVRLSAAEEFDYIDGDSLLDLQFQNGAGKKIVVLPFSLGQLEPIESAQEAALRPLYCRLCQKIVDVISSQW